MPALDTCHPQIIAALQKDGWQIVAEQHRLRIPGRAVHNDPAFSPEHEPARPSASST